MLPLAFFNSLGGRPPMALYEKVLQPAREGDVSAVEATFEEVLAIILEPLRIA